MADVRRTALALGLTTLLLGGCAADPAPVPAPSPSALDGREAASTAPLRGIPVPEGSLDRAALAVKIDNHPAARPQIALEKSDIVFEELVEGGLTRYAAIWHTEIPAVLGPVRSIRPMDPDILSPFGGIVAYSGGQERFVRLMQATPVHNLVDGAPDTAALFFRSDAKVAPHNLLLRAGDAIAGLPDIAAPAPQFSYSDDAASSTAVALGEPTATIAYRFSESTAGTWTWDGVAGSFLRGQDGAPDLDATGTQLAATNVIVLRVDVTALDDVPRTEVVGSGDAWVSTGGATAHATWSKKTAGATMRVFADDGTRVELAPGNSWIELVPTAGSVEFVPPPGG